MTAEDGSTEEDGAGDKYGKYTPGTLVEFKLGKLPSWPAMVIPDEEVPEVVRKQRPAFTKSKKRDIALKFFQSCDFYWVAQHQLRPFDKEKADMITAPDYKTPNGQKKLREAYEMALKQYRKQDGTNGIGPVSAGVVFSYDGPVQPRKRRKRKRERVESVDRKRRRTSSGSDDEEDVVYADNSDDDQLGDGQGMDNDDESSDEEEEEEEIEYETIAARATETIKNRIFIPVNDAKRRGRVLVLSNDQAEEVNEWMTKLGSLRRSINATDVTNVMKLVENYRLSETLTDFRNHFICGEVEDDGNQFEDRAEELLRHWWALQNAKDLLF